ncbi:MAG: hypothetical protein J4F35_09335 [Candidatus Latescibacteria bacterium]|nr:hypothetical protein [Candidatus Latescibacterota bacterium]
MLRYTVMLCALWALPADGQDGLLGTWEHSQDGIETPVFTWKHNELTLEDATVFYDTLAGQSIRRATFKKDGTFREEWTVRLDFISVDGLDDLTDEALADLEKLDIFNKAATDGIGTWRTAGDSLWIELDEVIIYEDDTEIKWSEIPTTDIYEIGDGEPMSEEHRADLEELFSPSFKLLVWQMEFTGTYQIAGDSLLLTFLGLDGVDRTRAYTRTTTVPAP